MASITGNSPLSLKRPHTHTHTHTTNMSRASLLNQQLVGYATLHCTYVFLSYPERGLCITREINSNSNSTIHPPADQFYCALIQGVIKGIGWTQTGWDSLPHPLFTSGLPWVMVGLGLVQWLVCRPVNHQ